MNLTDFKVVLPVIISFAVCAILSPILIPFLKRLKFGQYIRQEGPESHLKRVVLLQWGYSTLAICITSLIL